jgi:hypothetical protein
MMNLMKIDLITFAFNLSGDASSHSQNRLYQDG